MTSLVRLLQLLEWATSVVLLVMQRAMATLVLLVVRVLQVMYRWCCRWGGCCRWRRGWWF